MKTQRRLKLIKQLKSNEIAEVREWILKEQNGICPICDNEVKKPCLDHHHTKKVKGTGQVRGVVCLMCNVFIGKSENNCKRYGISNEDLPRVLRNVADYLAKDQYPLLHPSEAPKQPVLKKSSYNILIKELKKINYKGKVPFYRLNEKLKKVQKLTKPLDKLFKKINIIPEFY